MTKNIVLFLLILLAVLVLSTFHAAISNALGFSEIYDRYPYYIGLTKGFLLFHLAQMILFFPVYDYRKLLKLNLILFIFLQISMASVNSYFKSDSYENGGTVVGLMVIIAILSYGCFSVACHFIYRNKTKQLT